MEPLTQQGVIAPLHPEEPQASKIINGPKQGLLAANKQFLSLQSPKEEQLASNTGRLADIAESHAASVARSYLKPDPSLLLPALYTAFEAHQNNKNHQLNHKKALESMDSIAEALDNGTPHPVADAMRSLAAGVLPQHSEGSLGKALAVLPKMQQFLQENHSTANIAQKLTHSGMSPKQSRLALVLAGRGDTMVGDPHQVNTIFGLSHQDEATKKSLNSFFEDNSDQHAIHELVDILSHSSPMQRVLDKKLDEPELLPAKAFYFGLSPEDVSRVPKESIQNVQSMTKLRNTILNNLTKKTSETIAKKQIANQRFALADQLLAKDYAYDPSLTPNEVSPLAVPTLLSPSPKGSQNRLSQVLDNAQSAMSNYGLYGQKLDDKQTQNLAKVISANERMRQINKNAIKVPHPQEAQSFDQPEWVQSELEQINQAVENNRPVSPHTKASIKTRTKELSQRLSAKEPNTTDQYLTMIRAGLAAEQADQQAAQHPPQQAPFVTPHFQGSNLLEVHKAAKGDSDAIRHLMTARAVSHEQALEALRDVQELVKRSSHAHQAVDALMHNETPESEKLPEGLRKNLHQMSLIRTPFYKRSPVMRRGHHSKYGSTALVYSYYSKVVPSWLRHHNATKGAAQLKPVHQPIHHGFPHMRKTENALSLARKYLVGAESLLDFDNALTEIPDLKKADVKMAMCVLPPELQAKLSDKLNELDFLLENV